MWTDSDDTAQDAKAEQPPARQPPASRTVRATPAERLRANSIIRRRPLCEHYGYSGTDPITGVVLCAICRRLQTNTEATQP